MRDYDVEALSLAVPPVSAPVAAYRPAVLVRNNGIYPANVTGTMRVYRREPPGDLLATFSISLAALQPGANGSAQSSQYWTPTTADVGREFLFTADVDTILDQLESNNHLSPVTVLVVEGEPEPPSPVEAHATQHEAGGADQVNVTGLSGALLTAQVPTVHKISHQAGGSDPVNVNGLSGLLAESQTPAAHAPSHKLTGSDLINVAELAGATGLEHIANKGTENGYAGLGPTALVPQAQLAVVHVPPFDDDEVLRYDQTYGAALPALHAAKHESGGADPILGMILPTGLIAIWNITNPVPDGWILDPVLVFPSPPYVYIQFNPGAG